MVVAGTLPAVGVGLLEERFAVGSAAFRPTQRGCARTLPGAAAIVADPGVPVDEELLDSRGRLAEGGRQLRRGLRPHRSRGRSAAWGPRDEHARRPHERDGRARRHAHARRGAPGRRGGRDRAQRNGGARGARGLPRTRACRRDRRARGLRADRAARGASCCGLRRPPALHLALASDGVRPGGALRARRASARGRLRERARSPRRRRPGI